MKATDDLGRGPANREEIIPYLKAHGEPADIFRSANDHEDFVVFWNVDYRECQREGKPFPVIAHEKTGSNGMRYILQVRIISQVTNAQLQQLPFPPGQQAPS